MSRSPMPPGRPRWDAINGLRIGAVAGGVVGAAVIAVTGSASFWIIVACGALGGGLGYVSSRHS